MSGVCFTYIFKLVSTNIRSNTIFKRRHYFSDILKYSQIIRNNVLGEFLWNVDVIIALHIDNNNEEMQFSFYEFF